MRHLLPAVAALTLLLLTACQSTGTRTQDHADTADEAKPLVVVSYNIKHGYGMDGTVDLQRTADRLASLNADVILLQEVDEYVERSGNVNQAEWLGEQLGMGHAFGPFMDLQGGRYGLAILSRQPIDAQTVFTLPPGESEPRVALGIDLQPDGWDTPVTVICVHFDWLRDDTNRFAQASTLLDKLADHPNPVIIAGDYNDTPESRTMALFREHLTNADKPADDRFTIPSDNPRREIDFIMHSPSLAATDVDVIHEPLVSDHRPVIATITPVTD